jgi:hypothetical protein
MTGGRQYRHNDGQDATNGEAGVLLKLASQTRGLAGATHGCGAVPSVCAQPKIGAVHVSAARPMAGKSRDGLTTQGAAA